MIKSFFDRGTENVFDRIDSKAARSCCPAKIWRIAQRKLDQLNAVLSLESLKIPPGNCLEKLKADREGQHGIRINDQYRICFYWIDDGAENVEIVDYHP